MLANKKGIVIDQGGLTNEGKIRVIAEIVRKKLKLAPNKEILLNDSLGDCLGADSLSVVSIVMAIEDYFGVDIEVREGQSPKSVKELKDALDKALGN